MPLIKQLFSVVCKQCHWQWNPRIPHPQRCVNPKCQARDWDGPYRKKRKYHKSWLDKEPT